MELSFIDKLTQLTYYRGRVALYAILRELGIGKGDNVALQAFTCVAVPEAIIATGAVPIYIDIQPNGVNMDPEDLNSKMTRQVRAIIVQHTYGLPANIQSIKYLSDKYNIPIIEDCCHTLMSKINNKRVGSFGVASFYSFEWGKPIVAGVGGSALVNDINLRERLINNYPTFREPNLCDQLKILVQYCIFRCLYRPSRYWLLSEGLRKLSSMGLAKGNYNPMVKKKCSKDFSLKMSRVLLIILCKQLLHIREITEHSKLIASRYLANINCRLVSHFPDAGSDKVVLGRYPLLTESKSLLIKKARQAQIELSGWYSSPVHPLKDD